MTKNIITEKFKGFDVKRLDGLVIWIKGQGPDSKKAWLKELKINSRARVQFTEN
jgi:hypothetical protein